jgi:hypothetical protein
VSASDSSGLGVRRVLRTRFFNPGNAKCKLQEANPIELPLRSVGATWVGKENEKPRQHWIAQSPSRRPTAARMLASKSRSKEYADHDLAGINHSSDSSSTPGTDKMLICLRFRSALARFLCLAKNDNAPLSRARRGHGGRCSQPMRDEQRSGYRGPAKLLSAELLRMAFISDIGTCGIFRSGAARASTSLDLPSFRLFS